MGVKYKSDEWYESEQVTVSATVSLASVNGTVQLANSTAGIGFATVKVAAGAAYIGLASVNVGGVAAGANYIGLASVNIGGTLPALSAGTAGVGFATVNVAGVAAGANYIGLASVNISPIPTGTNYIGLASVNVGGTLPTGANWIGLVSTASINGNVNLATLISGEDQTNDVLKTEGQFLTSILTSNTTTAVKAAAGFVHVMNVGVMSCPSICLYDAVTPSTTPVFTLAPGAPVGTYMLDIKMATGITLNCQGGVAPIVQISYR